MTKVTLITYFIHMITSCEHSYFFIHIGVHFPYLTSRTQRGLSLAALLQVTCIFSYLLVSIDHDDAFLLCQGQYYDSIRATQTSLAMRDTKHVNHHKTSPIIQD